jgi:cytochrome c peroxidase
MPQIFHRRSNSVARASVLVVVLLIIFSAWGLHAVFWSPLVTKVDMPQTQPVMFSHEHHASGLGIDCRYCHTSVEKSSFAGMPPTETCLTCHSQIWTQAPLLAPVRESLATHQPIRWNRVHDLPDFVYFDHSIHINKGVGCNTCHGPVDRMPLMYNYASLQMEWCIECHRAPEKNLRPREQVFNMRYLQPTKDLPVVADGQTFTDQLSLGKHLVKEYKLRSVMDITSCSTCHR